MKSYIRFENIKIGSLYTAEYYDSERVIDTKIIFVTSKISSGHGIKKFEVHAIHGISNNKQIELDYFNYYFRELI